MVKIDVFSYATNYDYHIYERFIGTLNDTGFSGNIYLIISQNDVNYLNLIKKKYKNVFYFIDETIKNRNTHLNNHRFFITNNYLEQLSNINEYILFCDFRDVLFQK